MHTSELAISVRGLSKAYRIAHAGAKPTTMGEAVLQRLRRPLARQSYETFWALQELSFDVARGEVVGVIGRNGAGKSTFLKILSRITEPTQGYVDVYGRVGSLLEVGTGFHPELTGRENVYLNGQILGMRRREIDRQFDAIVDFAGVEKFLDTPVKRYSSGMYVRLAFAVAAHLDSDVLVVDEVLAVGDAEFQKKCLGKMGDVARSGRTVLFVSHSMQAVSALCSQAIVLHNGRFEFQGDVNKAMQRYFELGASGTTTQESPDRRPGSGEYRFHSVVPARTHFDPTDEKTISFRIRRHKGTTGQLYLSGLLVNSSGVRIAQFDSRLVGCWLGDSETMQGELRIRHPWPNPGRYQVDLFICSLTGVVDRFDAACGFDVNEALPYAFAASADGYNFGLVISEFDWNMQPQPAVRVVNTLGGNE